MLRGHLGGAREIGELGNGALTNDEPHVHRVPTSTEREQGATWHMSGAGKKKRSNVDNTVDPMGKKNADGDAMPICGLLHPGVVLIRGSA